MTAIFHGPIANCVGCHGPGWATVQAATLDYDDWTKDFTTRVGITPTDREAMRPLREAGALPPRPNHHAAQLCRTAISPWRGRSGERLYRRITQGIAGTPMPSELKMSEERQRKVGLSVEPDLGISCAMFSSLSDGS